jgi:KDO2-lipid IV(A) lauroyltransferase
MAAEFCHMKNLTPENIATRITFDDPKFWNDNKHVIGTTGILILTGHFGNWELFAHAMGMYGHPIHLIHRPFRNPVFDRFVNEERSRAGTGLISKRRAAREVVRVLRDHGIVAVPFDQNATGRWGVFAEFFGVPASTHPGLARLAMLSGSPVYPAFLVRQNGTWNHRIWIQPEVERVQTGDRDRDTIETLRRFNKVFEEAVRRHPDHWIWMHKRWRTRPPGEPSLYG